MSTSIPRGRDGHRRGASCAVRPSGRTCCRFRELIAALGSGERSGRALSRAEAAEAVDHLLAGRCTEAQAGAFLIAHRLRRPMPQELAGMLDCYRRQGPRLAPIQRRVLSFGVPFDGRVRSAPLLPLLALLLAAAGAAVVLHGGDPMPVKYGLTGGRGPRPPSISTCATSPGAKRSSCSPARGWPCCTSRSTSLPPSG